MPTVAALPKALVPSPFCLWLRVKGKFDHWQIAPVEANASMARDQLLPHNANGQFHILSNVILLHHLHAKQPGE
jgi:hypothetical protein